MGEIRNILMMLDVQEKWQRETDQIKWAIRDRPNDNNNKQMPATTLSLAFYFMFFYTSTLSASFFLPCQFPLSSINIRTSISNIDFPSLHLPFSSSLL